MINVLHGTMHSHFPPIVFFGPATSGNLSNPLMQHFITKPLRDSSSITTEYSPRMSIPILSAWDNNRDGIDCIAAILHF